MNRGFSNVVTVTVLGLAVCLAACATPSVLGVNYRTPEPTAQRIQRTVVLEIEDARASTAFLTPMARDELEKFSNAFALTVSGPAGSELRGAYELVPLFREILRARLEAAGARVAASGAADARFKFVLKEFKLDFGDRKWSSRMSYDAMLMRDGSVLSSQTVNGSAERIKIMGQTEAEKLLSELLTDTVNEMNVAALFRQAGL